MDTRYLKILIVSLMMLTVTLAYAATRSTINNAGTVVVANRNFQGITFSPPLSQPNCSTETSYSDGGGTGALSPISWGNVAQGSSQTAYICVRNADDAGQSYAAATSSLSPTTGITVSYNGTATLTSRPLPNGGASLII